jgi:Spy/CpxP family protein refolding chaperone
MNVRWKSYIILLVTFSLGISAGFLGARALILSTMREAFRMGGPPGRMGHGFHPTGDREHEHEFGPRLEKHIANAAHPTEEQKQKLLPIVKKYQQSLDAVMEEHRARAHALLDSMDKELATVLDAGQMEKLRARRQHPPGEGDHGDRERHGWGDERFHSDGREEPGRLGEAGQPGESARTDGERPTPPDRQGED